MLRLAASVLPARATPSKNFRSFQSNIVLFSFLCGGYPELRLFRTSVAWNAWVTSPAEYTPSRRFASWILNGEIAMDPQFDADGFKAGARMQWDKSADGWNDHTAMIHRWLDVATTAMLDVASIRAGSHVLDVAAGAGDQTLEIAKRVGPKGHVVATDISPAILEKAASNLARAGYGNSSVEVMDAERLTVAPGAFDAAISRLGLMFCPNPVAALAGMCRSLKPGGRAACLVFSTPQANPCVAILMSVASKYAGLPPVDPFQRGSLFSLGKPGFINTLFREAGFVDVATTAISAPFDLASVDEYTGFVRASASPILKILASLDRRLQDQAWTEIGEALGRFNRTDGWSGPNELLLTCGMRH
jgi:ubiquinone/menaquinone biosynthesis C-methylase UbiE